MRYAIGIKMIDKKTGKVKTGYLCKYEFKTIIVEPSAKSVELIYIFKSAEDAEEYCKLLSKQVTQKTKDNYIVRYFPVKADSLNFPWKLKFKKGTHNWTDLSGNTRQKISYTTTNKINNARKLY